MASEIELGMAKMFSKAVQESAVRELRTPGDWEAFNEIGRETKRQIDGEMAQFNQNREALIAEQKKALIDEAGSRRLEHPTPFGTDRFNPKTIGREAERRVENGHQSRLLKIHENAATKYTDLADKIRAREQVRGRAHQDFEHATDRRQNNTRSGPMRD